MEMNNATVIGLVGGLGLVALAISLGGDASAFFNARALLIVFGGTIAVTLVSFRAGEVIEALRAAGRTLFGNTVDARSSIEKLLKFAEIARKDGVHSLERRMKDVRGDHFLTRALSLVIDGSASEEIERLMDAERATLKSRAIKSSAILRRASEIAPAMGLIGTLVGLVQMLADLDDPSKIGPAMAVALITTFYGAVFGSMILAPLAAKLDRLAHEQNVHLAVFTASASAISRKENPRRLQTLVNAMLPPSEQVNVYS
jgi:chemotaxis protein MotA